MSKGYVMIKLPTGEWALEHRHVMEVAIGRPLRKGEVVHHTDGDRTNNVLGNLEIMLLSQHLSYHKTEYWKRWRAEHNAPPRV